MKPTCGFVVPVAMEMRSSLKEKKKRREKNILQFRENADDTKLSAMNRGGEDIFKTALFSLDYGAEEAGFYLWIILHSTYV